MHFLFRQVYSEIQFLKLIEKIVIDSFEIFKIYFKYNVII